MKGANTVKEYTITDLCGMAWHSAIENVIERLSRHSFAIIHFGNYWQQAELYAIKNNLHFDVDGNLI